MKAKILDRIFKTLLCLSLIAGMILMGLNIFWLAETTVPAEITQVVVKTPVVEQGGTLIYDMHYCRYTDDKALSIRKFFENGIIYESTDSDIQYGEVGCSVITKHLTVPSELPPSEYRIHIIARYKLNPERDFIVDAYTPEFKIITKE